MEFIKTMQPIIDLLAALTSPIVAITVAYIAYQQWKLNSRKASKEIQNEKLEIYMAVKRFLNHFDRYIEIDKKLYKDFEEAIALAEFTFTPEVNEWLSNVYLDASSWADLNSIIELSKGKPNQEHMQQHKNHIDKTTDKLQNAHCELFDIFKDKVISKKS